MKKEKGSLAWFVAMLLGLHAWAGEYRVDSAGALDADGAVYRADNQDRNRDGIRYRPVADLTADLVETASNRGNRIPIRLDTDREVPVQKVIEVLDTLALQGFDNVGVRLRHRQEEFFLLEDLAR